MEITAVLMEDGTVTLRTKAEVFGKWPSDTDRSFHMEFDQRNRDSALVAGPHCPQASGLNEGAVRALLPSYVQWIGESLHRGQALRHEMKNERDRLEKERVAKQHGH